MNQPKYSFNYCPQEIVKQLTVIHYGSEHLDRNLFLNVGNAESKRWQKPLGGLWTSRDEFIPAWKRICLDYPRFFPSLNKQFKLKFKSDTRIALVDSYKDLENLPMLHAPEEIFDTNVNWKLISHYVDAVWLTGNGRRETRLTIPYNLTLWDCECVFIMNIDCCYEIPQKDCR